MSSKTTARPTRAATNYCDAHSKLGKDHCPMLDVRRADIDQAVFVYFEKVTLDVEATRAQFAGSRDRKLAEVRSLLEQAQRQELLAEERLQRVRRDYADGRLEAEDWASFKDELSSDRGSAHAEVERLTASLVEVERDSELLDAESETLRKLAEIRKAIAGEVQDANGIEAVRAALLRLFERFIVHVDGDQGRIEAVVKPEAIRTVEGGEMRPVLHRIPLGTAENNQRVGWATR